MDMNFSKLQERVEDRGAWDHKESNMTYRLNNDNDKTHFPRLMSGANEFVQEKQLSIHKVSTQQALWGASGVTVLVKVTVPEAPRSHSQDLCPGPSVSISFSILASNPTLSFYREGKMGPGEVQRLSQEHTAAGQDTCEEAPCVGDRQLGLVPSTGTAHRECPFFGSQFSHL